jgi:hypothetical protein
MLTYNVYFSAKESSSELALLEKCYFFLENLKKTQQIESYRLLRITNPANFKDLPSFQLIVDYSSRDQLDASFAFMRSDSRFKEAPHSYIMDMVQDFRVSFAEDAIHRAEQGAAANP